MKNIFLAVLFFFIFFSNAQNSGLIIGKINYNSQDNNKINLRLLNTAYQTISDSLGNFEFKNIPANTYKIQATALGFETYRKVVQVKTNETIIVNFDLKTSENQLNDVVITGTLKAVKRLESPVPVEVYSPVFFKKKSNSKYF